MQNSSVGAQMSLLKEDHALVLQKYQVKSTQRRIEITKAAGPDRVLGRTLKSCTDQLTGVFADVVNLSLQQAVVPIWLKSTTIVPVSKMSAANSHNDCCPGPNPCSQ